MARKLLCVNDIKEGMIIDEDLYSIFGTLIISKDTKATKNVIDKLKSNLIQKIYIKDAHDDKITLFNPEDRKQQVASFQVKFNSIQDDLHTLMEGVVFADSDINVDEINSKLDELTSITDSSGSLLSILSQMKSDSEVTYTHFLQVALLSRIFAKWLKWSQKDIEMVGAAALFHDIGKCKIDPTLLNKKEKITKNEFNQLQNHALLGHDLLLKNNLDPQIILTALSHHERCDGSGYPIKNIGYHVCDYARLVAITDVYAAMTANRPYRDKFCPFEVLNEMEQEGFKKYDPKYLLVFLSNISNCYLHQMVRLSNNQIGEIIFINTQCISRPVVKVDREFLDLSLYPDLKILEIL